MTFAKQLAAARKQAGLTIRDAAIRAGYSNSFIRKCEAGKHTPPARAILPILAAIKGPKPQSSVEFPLS